ncbi:MAG: TonB C-terminal domain-containing protein [Thiovulaceae bacterium]|nr:TonB C-terminal domain-containing protein [Sulfurimonadaceae bacterium]
MQSSPDDRYFYLSGLISLGLFLATLLLFALVVLDKSKIRTFAMQKENYISVSLDTDAVIPTQNDAEPSPVPTPKQEVAPEPEPVVEESEATPESTNTDVSSLFDDVWTENADTKVVKKEVKVDAKRLAAIEKRIETKKSKHTSKASEQIKTLQLVKPSIEVVGASASTAPEVNEYLAKIHALIKSKFFPPASSEGESAKVLVKLDANGHITDYRVLVPSGSNIFNEEVERLYSRLKRIDFSANPDGKSISLEIILTVEEK